MLVRQSLECDDPPGKSSTISAAAQMVCHSSRAQLSSWFLYYPDTIPPAHPLQDKNDDNHNTDIRELVDSGAYTLAPAHPLVTRPFPVQPIPKTSHSYATAPPLDRTKRPARRWELATREIRTIAGGSWKARTWMGGTCARFVYSSSESLM